MDNFLKKADKILDTLISPGDKVVAGVSGGADSIALLYVLNHFSDSKNYGVVVAHVNHLTRGEDSYKDAEFVKSVADILGLPFYLKEVDVGEKRLQLKLSFQEAARLIRYQFLEETLSLVGGNKIAVGHTADDQVETILMNFVRGTGLKGLTGITQTRGSIIRPLLEISRREIESFLKDKDYAFRVDSSNQDNKYLRNRVRNELIPNLESYNPNIKNNLNEMSRIVGEDDALLDRMTQEIFEKNLKNQNADGSTISWNIENFMSNPFALRQRLVREIFFHITGKRVGLTAHHVKGVMDLYENPKVGKVLNIPGNILVTCGYESIQFERNPDDRLKDIEENQPNSTPILIPGMTELAEGEIRVQAQILDVKREFSSLNSKMQAFLDFDKTGFSIKARFFRPGDRFHPLGMSGVKKLKSFFIDKKIPKKIRGRIPLLTNENDDIIWVYGQRIAHFCRVTEKTRKILFVQGDKPINY
ncbi:MAG: tRNA lysidine(34) synthetase TilS [Nitrospinota bacterium]